MRGIAKRLVPLITVALVGSLFAAPTAAEAANTLNVQVGEFLGGPSCDFETGKGCIPGEGMRFYAPALKVQSGDVVNFELHGFHTATLLPANTDVHGWVQANAGGVGKPWSLLVPDPDDTAAEGGTAERPAVKANNRVIFPPEGCGSVDNPCDYDRTQVLNSGLPFAEPPTFAARINGNPGDVIWVICLVHPHMRLKITITDNAAEASTQDAIDSAKRAMIAQDNESAASMHRKLLQRSSRPRTTAGGKRVWDAWAGWDNHWIALLAFYPRTLKIRKGDTVRWHFTELVYEDHTASLPKRFSMRLLQTEMFVPSCDPDGDTGAQADNPPEVEGPPFCNDPQQLEFDISARVFNEAGDGVFNGRRRDFENSGIKGANFANGPYDVRFTKRSGDKPFKYICLIHGPFMTGRVLVK